MWEWGGGSQLSSLWPATCWRNSAGGKWSGWITWKGCALFHMSLNTPSCGKRWKCTYNTTYHFASLYISSLIDNSLCFQLSGPSGEQLMPQWKTISFKSSGFPPPLSVIMTLISFFLACGTWHHTNTSTTAGKGALKESSSSTGCQTLSSTFLEDRFLLLAPFPYQLGSLL